MVQNTIRIRNLRRARAVRRPGPSLIPLDQPISSERYHHMPYYPNAKYTAALNTKGICFLIDDEDRLLVFEQPDFPSAGVQVPAGTIERHEQPLTAALRELCEETGKQSFEIIRFVARKQNYEVRHGPEELHDRRFFQASPTQSLPKEWMFGESTPTGWIPFHFYWMSRTKAESSLTPDHAEVYRLTSAELNRK